MLSRIKGSKRGLLLFTLISVSLPFATLKAEENSSAKIASEVVHFKNGKLSLGGILYKPNGPGPFPTLLYNHASAPGMMNSQAAELIAPYFVKQGWVFFMPYRRGQGLSSSAGKYIGDEIEAAEKEGGRNAAESKMVMLLKTEQFDDQIAAYGWIKEQKFIDKKRIAVAGNSFGGIETVLSDAHENFCAAVDASGGAESWNSNPELQNLMKESVRNSKCPIFFFQAENDFDLSLTKTLSLEMKRAGKVSEVKIYPKFGSSGKEGHSFAYRGVES